MHKRVALIGYSGHAFVAADILLAMGRKLEGYFEPELKSSNPFQIKYLGDERQEASIEVLRKLDYVIAVGDNNIRSNIQRKLSERIGPPLTIEHPSSWLSPSSFIGEGVMISSFVSINALAQIGNGVICNTGSIVEHECNVGSYTHIAPGCVLCGNVQVGEYSLIGANSVVKPGIKIGDHVIIGAGSVIVKNIPSHSIVIGNPQKNL